ncbi:MAG: PHP domain-containing protein, partial [Dethiobacteria bacterium]
MSRGHLPVDLHLHSTASDGSLSPARLIEKASAAGLAAVALTDHDTLDGVKEALEAGRRCGLEVLPGVEISVQAGEQEIHLLGYDPLYPEKISAFLEEMRRERYRRMQQMTARLRRLGFSISD